MRLERTLQVTQSVLNIFSSFLFGGRSTHLALPWLTITLCPFASFLQNLQNFLNILKKKPLVSLNVPSQLETLLSRKVFFGLFYAKKLSRNPETIPTYLITFSPSFLPHLLEQSILHLKLFTTTCALTLILYLFKNYS